MRKTTLNIFVFGFFVTVLFVSCAGKELSEKNQKKETSESVIDLAEHPDTVWLSDIQFDFFESTDFKWDTIVEMDQQIYLLVMTSEMLPQPYEGVVVEERDDTLFAQKFIGPNSLFEFGLYDSLGNEVGTNSFDKYELEQYFEDKELLAGSKGDRWYFGGYYELFNQFFIDTYWMFEESDVGASYKLFMDNNLMIKDFFFDSSTGGGACDCGELIDNRWLSFAFCSRIYRANGKHTPLSSNDTEVTGSFQINDNVSLVIYNYHGKPPFKNAKLLGKRGEILKSFDYQGMEEGLGYMIPRFQVPDQKALFLTDAVRKVLIRIDLEQPTQLRTLEIDDLERWNESSLKLGDTVLDYVVNGDHVAYHLKYFNKQFFFESEKRW